MNLRINLATRVYVDYQKINLMLALLFLVIASWGSLSLYSISVNDTENGRLQQLINKSKGSGTEEKVSETEFNRVMANIRFANSILDKKGYDWLALLDNIELSVPAGVSLKGLSPADKGGQIKISGTAVNFATVRRVVEQLEGSGKFRDVYLVEQTFFKEGNNVKGINFTVTCKAVN